MHNTQNGYTPLIGYHLGQFNQQGEKRQPYDEDIRVPFIVRGPGVPANATTSALALNIDLVSHCCVSLSIELFVTSIGKAACVIAMRTQSCYSQSLHACSLQAPTFIELAGVSVPEDMDGTSLKAVLLSEEERKRQVSDII